MTRNLIARATIQINAPALKVWEALTNPVLIKKYLFGTETKTDWQVGSPITFEGEWEGKAYQDKGKILAFDIEKLLKYTYWSSFSGLPDSPENYANVSFELQPRGNGSLLVVTQDHCASEESRNHSEQNWNTVLNGIKELTEPVTY